MWGSGSWGRRGSRPALPLTSPSRSSLISAGIQGCIFFLFGKNIGSWIVWEIIWKKGRKGEKKGELFTVLEKKYNMGKREGAKKGKKYTYIFILNIPLQL